MFDSLDISASALLAQRTRMDTIAGNIANMNTTRNTRGEPAPYRRRFAVFASGQADASGKAGVSVSKIEIDHSPFRKEYQPNHPDADKEGYVSYPNIDLAAEYVNRSEERR